MNDVLNVSFFSVEKQISDIKCESVRLPVADSVKGDFSGSYGIKKGHARAVFSLKEGTVILTSDDKTVLSVDISDGFATVSDNQVSITVDSLNEYTK